MGQYHVLVNYDKKEVVVPHALGLGLKQWEHLGDFSGTLSDALYVLTMTSPNRGGGDLPLTAISGRWAGDRCFVYGDYTEDSDLPNIPNGGSLNTEGEGWTDISEQVADALGRVFEFKMVGDSGWKQRTPHTYEPEVPAELL
jgi:hypothetical protein